MFAPVSHCHASRGLFLWIHLVTQRIQAMLSKRLPRLVNRLRHRFVEMLVSEGKTLSVSQMFVRSKPQRGEFCIQYFHPNSAIRDAVKVYEHCSQSTSTFDLQLSENVGMLHSDPVIVETLFQHLFRVV